MQQREWEMERADFGRVVASLRQERRDVDTGRVMSQSDLAKACSISLKTIGQIERGEKVNLESDLLLNLARAFNLTSIERVRFIQMASNVDEEDVIETDYDENLSGAIDEARNLFQPVLLHDGLYRIRAINSAYMQVYGLKQNYLDSIPNSNPTKYHVVRHIHEPSSPVRTAYASQIQATEMNNILYWRYLSIAHRQNELYGEIQRNLFQIAPNFKRLWAELLYTQHEDERTDALRIFEHNHPDFGHLHYNVISAQLFTSGDELFMTALTPMDRQTMLVFNRLVDDVGFRLHVFG